MSRLLVENVSRMALPESSGKGAKAEPRRVLDEVSFSIPSGGSLSVFGENHSGKMALTLGLVRIHDFNLGSFYSDEVNLRKLGLRRFRSHFPGIQAVFPDDFGQLPPELTVDRILREVLLSRKRFNRERIGFVIDRIMIQAGLSVSIRYLLPSQLDPVERQLVALARALLQRPSILVLHDIARGMDAVARAETLNQFRAVADLLDLTTLYLTGDLGVACHMGDQLAILHRGRILECDATESVIRNPQHDYTKRLVSRRL